LPSARVFAREIFDLYIIPERCSRRTILKDLVNCITLKNDPWEMNNLYFEKEYGKKVDELQKDLMEWLITTTRPKTVLQSTSYKGDQGYTRYHNTVNGDGKMNPERIVMGGNYT
jgi:hypothetical protein